MAADDTATKTQDFSPKGDRFTIQMPGKPQEEIKKLNTAVGPIDLHLFVYSPDPDTAYIASYCDYPEVKKSASEKILDGARDGAVKNLKGKLDQEKKITIDRYPGRDLVILTAGYADRQRIYLVDNRLYQVLLVGSREFVTGKDAEKFLASFKLTDK